MGPLIAFSTFAETLRGGDVRALIDSAAARGVLIKTYSASRHLTAIAVALWRTVGAFDVAMWLAHVPSKANLADAPSRGDFQLAEKLDWQRLQAKVPDCSHWERILTTQQKPGRTR